MQRIDYSRCIDCFDCIENCPQKALAFTTRISIKPTENNTEVSNAAVSRRQFLATSALSLAGAVAFITKATASPSTGSAGEHSPVLPPGSKSQNHLSAHCTSCHLCVSKCPTQTLKPMSIGYGIGTIMQPAMDFKKGYCDYDCNLCGVICPNHAIEQLPLEQKRNIKIGYGVFDLTRCVVETDNVNCGNCAVHCPAKAINMIEYKDKKIPSIDLSRCIGCGSCEYHCPVNPSAIHVDGFAEHK
jgi:formate hydrogenlyase subunit 6/NADH:ubiquinone oxidoreductase subunit I